MSRLQLEKYPWWRGLRFLAVGWTVLPLALLLILSVGAATIALQATVKLLAERDSLSQTSLAAGQLSYKLDQYRQALRVLADHPNLSGTDPEPMLRTFEQYGYLLTDFIPSGGLTVLNTDGLVVVTYPQRPELLGQDHKTQSYFLNLQNSSESQPIFFNVLEEPGTSRKMVGLAVPLRTEDQQFSGVLMGRFYLDVQPFGQIIRASQGATDSEAYLVDQRGQLIFHSNSELVGTDFSNQQAVVNLRRTGRPGAYTHREFDEPRQVFGYAPVEASGWGLVTSVPWFQVLQPVQSASTYITLVLVLGLIGLILVALWVVGRITQPLNRLVEQTQRAAAGAYDSQVSLSKISEVRELGLAFNHMVRQMGSYRSGLQEYVAAVTDSQEEERKRIARDLHDDTIQSLIAIGQRIELARDALEEQTVTQSRKQLTDVRAMVTDTIASVRQFSRDLRPLALEDLGLVPALQYLVNSLDQQDDITADLQIEGDASGLSQDLKTVVYRLLQEALSNIRRHAQATQILVTVRFSARQVYLEVQDNGVGFEVPATTADLASTGSFGLLGMEERVSLFGGDLSLYSAFNQGTIIRIILPHDQLPRRLEVKSEVS